MKTKAFLGAALLLTLCGPVVGATGDDDAATMPTQDLRAAGNPDLRYFLIGPPKGADEPRGGYALLVVLPGGTGDEGFLPFVQGIAAEALPEGYLVAQLVAPPWKTPGVTWPTRKHATPGMKTPVETFFETVVKDIAGKHKLDRSRVFTLSWSSGGPAAYAIALQKETSATGSFVAMSVFGGAAPVPPSQAKGRPFYIFHSPGDRVCSFRLAKLAQETLTRAGASVKFVTYDGPHGWNLSTVFDDIRTGIDWLELAASRQKAASPASQPAADEPPGTRPTAAARS